MDVIASATQFTYSNDESRRITAGFNLLIDRKNDKMTGDNFYGLEVGSMVEVPLSYGIQIFGVIRWMGNMPQRKGKLVAGLEMVR